MIQQNRPKLVEGLSDTIQMMWLTPNLKQGKHSDSSVSMTSLVIVPDVTIIIIG